MSSPRKWKWLQQIESDDKQQKWELSDQTFRENVISKKVKVITANWKWELSDQTFPGECHLQESESDYCKVKVMTNNKIIGGTFPGECHLHHELDRLHFGRQAQSRMRADELFSMAEIREKILAQIFRQKSKQGNLENFWSKYPPVPASPVLTGRLWYLPSPVCCERNIEILKH